MAGTLPARPGALDNLGPIRHKAKKAPLRNATSIEYLRSQIQSGQIIKRLQGHVDNKWEMSPTQIKAAEILLRKALPDLASVTLTDQNGNSPMQISWLALGQQIAGQAQQPQAIDITPQSVPVLPGDEGNP